MDFDILFHHVPAKYAEVTGVHYAAILAVGIVGFLVAKHWTDTVVPLFKFIYACFLQPIGRGTGQKERLDKFYAAQADAYDATRTRLLRGRETMLRLSASHLFSSYSQNGTFTKAPGQRLVWVDIGGGTGWNIEKMNEYCPIENFDAVYLIDLCEPLLEVAKKRFEKRGWKNVVCLCQDATAFFLPEWDDPHSTRYISLITLSYSLSMMPLPFPLIDRLNAFLHPKTGILGIVDFTVSPRLPSSQLIGDEGQYKRHVSWLGRWFWLHWFEFDHVDLHPSRRAYVEYVFGCLKSLNGRNNFGLLPEGWFTDLLGIPYYLGVFTKKDRDVGDAIQAFEVDGGNTISTRSSPSLSATSTSSRSSSVTKLTQFGGPLTELRLDESAMPLEVTPTRNRVDTKKIMTTTTLEAGPLSSFHYQLHKHYRLPYLESDIHKEFKSWIYGFVWEDPFEDMKHFNLTSEDEILAITSAGDNLLHYAISAQPRKLHAVDMNPSQNHLLELKLAAICALEYADFWKMFGAGRHERFRELLDMKLAPYLSAHAYQFWLANAAAFDKQFYLHGYSGWALRCIQTALSLAGVWGSAKRLCDAETLEEQRKIWIEKVKPVMTSSLVSWIVGQPAFLWNAQGVPVNQAKMFWEETTTAQYLVDTLDPVVCNEHLSKGAYWYYLCIKQHYTQDSCPLYLTPGGFATLQANSAALVDNFRLHTDSIINVLTNLPPHSLTIAVWMDHCDWFTPSVSRKDPTLVGSAEMPCELRNATKALRKALRPGGRVFLRSAAMMPWYIQLFEEEKFGVERIAVREVGAKKPIDGVNMYASFWRCTWDG